MKALDLGLRPPWRQRPEAGDDPSRVRLGRVADDLQRPRVPRRIVRAGPLELPVFRLSDSLLRARTIHAVLALPSMRVELTGSPGGRAIAASLLQLRGGHRLRNTSACGVYTVPAGGLPYKGRGAHSRRNAVNRAMAAGISIESVSPERLVDDPSVQSLGTCPEAPGCAGLTLVAFDAGGGLLAISHVHVDGPFAEIHRAVHAANNPLTGPVRYAIFAALVAELAAQGVETLAVLTSYLATNQGLRTYQHILGFHPINLRVRFTVDPVSRSGRRGSPRARVR